LEIKDLQNYIKMFTSKSKIFKQPNPEIGFLQHFWFKPRDSARWEGQNLHKTLVFRFGVGPAEGFWSFWGVFGHFSPFWL
jgi:hypothetical protein